MISREIIKSEISKVDNQYLEILYHIIKAFESVSVSEQENRVSDSNQPIDKEWISFIENTYGSLSEDPLERGEQGDFEIRVAVN